MAPKKRTQKQKKEEEEDYEEEEQSEEEEAPAKGKGKGKGKGKKATPAKKTKKEEAAEDEEEGTPSKRAKPMKVTEPTVIEPDAWTAHPPSLLYKDFGAPKNVSKIAAFDFDDTLAMVKSGAEWPKDANDWKFYNAEVPKKLKQYRDEGYRIVIFSNQGGVKSALTGVASEKARGRISNCLREAGVPAVAICATQSDEYRKPNTGMWRILCELLSPEAKPDPKASFFVGDASSVTSKIGSESDKEFAQNVGLPYRDVKQEFGEQDPAMPPLPQATGPNAELVDIFLRMKEMNKDHAFKSKANEKVAHQLAAFPKKITMDSKVLKEVNAMEGVGKGSMDYIKEYLTTGKVEALQALPADKVVGPSKPTKAQEEAAQFM